MQHIIELYDTDCDTIVRAFAEKQEMEFDGWAGGETGGVAFFGDYNFEFLDIVMDLRTNQPKGAILDWFFNSIDYSVDLGESCINYRSWIMGAGLNKTENKRN